MARSKASSKKQQKPQKQRGVDFKVTMNFYSLFSCFSIDYFMIFFYFFICRKSRESLAGSCRHPRILQILRLNPKVKSMSCQT